jgi:hypothetical protein
MSKIPAIKAVVFTAIVGGLGFSGGCGGGEPPPVGGTVTEDPKIYQDRQKAMENSYKQPPPSPFKKGQ